MASICLNDLRLRKNCYCETYYQTYRLYAFQKTYHRILPHQFEEVRKHLKEMLEIGAIKCSNSPWASTVVLVQKKDGSLRFCTDLRKLNARMIKDAYSLPRITETLDCLNGSQWFTSLDLKAEYWQVQLDEDS